MTRSLHSSCQPRTKSWCEQTRHWNEVSTFSLPEKFQVDGFLRNAFRSKVVRTSLRDLFEGSPSSRIFRKPHQSNEQRKKIRWSRYRIRSKIHNPIFFIWQLSKSKLVSELRGGGRESQRLLLLRLRRWRRWWRLSLGLSFLLSEKVWIGRKRITQFALKTLFLVSMIAAFFIEKLKNFNEFRIFLFVASAASSWLEKNLFLARTCFAKFFFSSSWKSIKFVLSCTLISIARLRALTTSFFATLERKIVDSNIEGEEKTTFLKTRRLLSRVRYFLTLTCWSNVSCWTQRVERFYDPGPKHSPIH